MIYHIKCGTGYCGEDCECMRHCGNDTTISDVEDYVEDCCRDNAELYGAIDRAKEEAEECNIEFEESDTYSYEIEEVSEEEAKESGLDVQEL